MVSASKKKHFFKRLKESVLGFSEPDKAENFKKAIAPSVEKTVANNIAISVPNIPIKRPPITEVLPENIDITFAENYTQSGGKFIYCETNKVLFKQVEQLANYLDWNWFLCWEEKLRKMMLENEFDPSSVGFFSEYSDVAISYCELLVAENGSLLLSPEQASRRTLPNFPQTHIIIADKNCLTQNYMTALSRYKQIFHDQLPQYIELGNQQKLQTVGDSLFLAAKGTIDIYLFFTDQILDR